MTSGAIKKGLAQLWALREGFSVIQARIFGTPANIYTSSNIMTSFGNTYFKEYLIEVSKLIIRKCFHKYTVSNKTGAPSTATKVIEFPTSSVKRKPEFGASRLS